MTEYIAELLTGYKYRFSDSHYKELSLSQILKSCLQASYLNVIYWKY